jgi:hypothetical protein
LAILETGEDLMIAAKWLRRAMAATLIAIPFVTAPGVVLAAVLYSNDFESATVGPVALTVPDALGLIWGYGSGQTTVTPAWSITASGGIGGSQGFTITENGQGSSSYSSIFGVPIAASDASPLGGGTVSSLSQLRFSMDIKPIGSIVDMPVQVAVFQYDSNYEADRGVDANQDGKMDGGATIYGSFLPAQALVEGTYTRVSFALDGGTPSAGITRLFPLPPVSFPLIPAFDPTVPLEIDVSFGSTGFGLDNGNSISVDNLLVESVPEPTTAALLVIGCAVALVARRR